MFGYLIFMLIMVLFEGLLDALIDLNGKNVSLIFLTKLDQL